MTCEDWPIVWPCDAPPSATPVLLDVARSAAQMLLWSRTGRRIGLCETTELYSPVTSGACGVPYMRDDLTWAHGAPGAQCCGLHLVATPVYRIEQVLVNGVEVPEGGYRLEGSMLSRVGACWPTVIDECDVPPVQVTYTWGVPIVGALYGLVVAAMGEVATEVLAGLCGTACKLPSRAVSVSRQGVTVEMGDPGEYARAGLLGMPLADALIGTVNPGGRRMRSRVFSPDMARRSVPTRSPAPVPVCVDVYGGDASSVFIGAGVDGGDAGSVYASGIDGGDAESACE